MRVFLAFLAAYTLSQFFRSFLAVVAPDLAADLSLTTQQLANISAVWFWAFAIAQLPVGWALDRHGPRRTMPLFMLTAAAGAATLSQASSYAACLAGMGLIGLGSAPIYVSAVFTFARTAPPERLATLSSWLLGIGTAGNLLGATPLALAVAAFGWRPTFIAIAILAVGIAGLAFVLLPALALAAKPPQERNQGFGSALLQIASIRGLWPLLPIILVSYAVMLCERGLWIGPYLAQVHGLDAVGRGNAVLIMAAAMSLGALAYGPLDRLLGTRKWIVLWGTLATAGLLLALGIWPGLQLGPAVALLAAIGAVGMTYAVLLAHACSFLPGHLLGRGITLINFFFFLGAGLLQPLSGALVAALSAQGKSPQQVFGVLHMTFGGLMLAACLVYLLSTDKRP